MADFIDETAGSTLTWVDDVFNKQSVWCNASYWCDPTFWCAYATADWTDEQLNSSSEEQSWGDQVENVLIYDSAETYDSYFTYDGT